MSTDNHIIIPPIRTGDFHQLSNEQCLTPQNEERLLQTAVLHSAAHRDSSVKHQLQVWVHLVAPVAVIHEFSRDHVSGDLWSVQQPGDVDGLGVEIKRMALQRGQLTVTSLTIGAYRNNGRHCWEDNKNNDSERNTANLTDAIHSDSLLSFPVLYSGLINWGHFWGVEVAYPFSLHFWYKVWH